MKTTEKKPAKHDDGLEWLREIRRKQAAACGNDPFEMGRRLREREKEFEGRMFTTKRVLVPVDGRPK
jgi:hypothetical protein